MIVLVNSSSNFEATPHGITLNILMKGDWNLEIAKSVNMGFQTVGSLYANES